MLIGMAYFAVRVRDIVWRAPRRDLEAAVACAPLTDNQRWRLLLLVLLIITPLFLFVIVWLVVGSAWVYSMGTISFPSPLPLLPISFTYSAVYATHKTTDALRMTCPHALYSYVYHFITFSWVIAVTLCIAGPLLQHYYRPLQLLHLRDEIDADI